MFLLGDAQNRTVGFERRTSHRSEVHALAKRIATFRHNQFRMAIVDEPKMGLLPRELPIFPVDDQAKLETGLVNIE